MPARAFPPALAALLLAGCAGSTVEPRPGDGDAALLAPPAFLAGVVDARTPGGEPVLAFLPDGALFVSAHRGPSLMRPSAGALDGLQGSSYQTPVWRSLDGGASWERLPTTGAAMGDSDPDLVALPDGTLCHAALMTLASASVSCTRDGGASWTANPLASGGPVDRPWLAAAGARLYLAGEGAADHKLLASDDLGRSWTRVAEGPPCKGRVVQAAGNGDLGTILGAPIGYANVPIGLAWCSIS